MAALLQLFLPATLYQSSELSLPASPRVLSKTIFYCWCCHLGVSVFIGGFQVVLPVFHPHFLQKEAKRALNLEMPVLGSTKALSLKNQTRFLLVLGCSQSAVLYLPRGYTGQCSDIWFSIFSTCQAQIYFSPWLLRKLLCLLLPSITAILGQGTLPLATCIPKSV